MLIKSLLKLSTITLFTLFAFLESSKPAMAINCSARPAGGNVTIDAACAFPNTIDGVDSGTGDTNTAVLTVTTGGTLTISAAQTLVVGSISMSGGSIAIISTGVIKIGAPLYITDADADGYPANTTQYISSATGRVRRNTLTNLTADCNDASASLYRSVAGYLDSDADGYGAGAYTTCAGAAGSYVASGSDCKDSGAYASYVMFSGLTCYYDADNDDWGQNTPRTCMNTQACATATWGTTGAADDAGNINFSSNASDCNDASASIYPGTLCGGGVCTICSTSGTCDNQTSAQDLFNQCSATSNWTVGNSASGLSCNQRCNQSSCSNGNCSGGGACQSAGCSCKSVGFDGADGGYFYGEFYDGGCQPCCGGAGGATCGTVMNNVGEGTCVPRAKYTVCTCGN